MNRAFTLVETIMAVALTAIVAMAIAFVLQYFYITDGYALQQAEAVASARQALESAMTLLREASYGADGTYPIQSAASSSVTFYAEENGTADEITYSLENSTLYEAEIAPGGSPLTYAGQSVSTSTIASYVTNGTSTPVFTYYNASGTTLTAPINIGDVASVKTTVIVDVNVNRAPVAFTLSAEATLRNLENQL